MKYKLRLTPAAAAALFLVACGSGSNTSAPVALNPSSGVAVDGYLSFAKITCDTNENGAVDTGEPSVYTLASGQFTFADGCTHGLLASGGKNADTGLLFVGILRAPAGAKVVTPLTTLMSAGLSQAQINATLGLPAGTNLLTTDPAEVKNGVLTDPVLLRKTLAVQQLLQKVTETFTSLAGAAGSAAIQPIYSEVAIAFAAALASGAKLNLSDTRVDDAVVQSLVKAAAAKVAGSGLVMPEVKAAVASINSTALAGVISGALKTQADSILLATDSASITAVTKEKQSSDVVALFVAQNKTALTGTPTATAVAALTTSLTQQVVAPPPAPSPVATGTVLLSFDESAPATSNMGAFAGALPSVGSSPVGGSGNALKIVKAASAEDFGGTYFNIAAIPFTATRKKINARVYSSRAASIIRLKVEASDGSFVEIPSVATGAANTWQTVTWDFSGVNLTKTYTTMAITPDVGVVAAGQTYYIDDLTLDVASTVPPAPPPPPPVGTAAVLISFDESTPATTNMGAYGGALPSVVAGPADGSGSALKIVKATSTENFGGTYFNVTAIPFTATRKKITARVYSSVAGSVIRFKVEAPGGIATEIVGAAMGAANTWQTVTWDFSAVDITKSYGTIAITPDSGVTASGQIYYIDDITLDVTAAATTPPPPPPQPPPPPPPPPAPTNYLSLVDDAIKLANGTTTTTYSMTAFQSPAGVNLSWPMSSALELKLNLSEVGTFVLAANQKVNAAVSITETAAGGQGVMKAYIENVGISKSGSSLVVSIPSPASSMVYGVSSNGAKKAVVDFSSGVANISNTLSMIAANVSSLLVGSVANYTINQLSNDFTGMNSLRGKYAVTIVFDGVPLKMANGTAMPVQSVEVPTSLGSNGAVLTTRPVTGNGLSGYITLTD